MISLYVAFSRNRVIGNKGDQPFYLPADLKRFKQITTGHRIIMGRKTFQAIVNRLGHPLPDRTNIVISRTLKPGEGYIVVPSIEKALSLASKEEETFVIGGAQVFEQTLDKAERIYLTEVDADLPGDVFFPEIKADSWRIESEERFGSDAKNPYRYCYRTLVRV